VWCAIVDYISKKYLKEPTAALDLGCGYGDFINNLKCPNKFAVDLNPDAANYLAPGIKFINSTADKLEAVESGSLDLIFSSNLLEHLDDSELERAAREFHRVLKVGGLMITMQPNYYYAHREYFDDYTHKKVFSHQSLQDFFSANGFKTNAMEKKFVPFSLKSRLPKTYMLTKLYLDFPLRPMAKQMLGVFRKV
jgi:ubiquinone/menaquinone biosynthesis C-methylase UbiE